MDAMNCSVAQLNTAIGQRLGMVSTSMSASELIEIHSFLKEAKSLRETIMSLGTFNEVSQTNYEEMTDEEAGETFFEMFIQGCHLINDLYKLLDDEKIKETDSEWVLEEVRSYMDDAREIFSNRVPALPHLRIISKNSEQEELTEVI